MEEQKTLSNRGALVIRVSNIPSQGKLRTTPFDTFWIYGQQPHSNTVTYKQIAEKHEVKAAIARVYHRGIRERARQVQPEDPSDESEGPWLMNFRLDLRETHDHTPRPSTLPPGLEQQKRYRVPDP
ncbi:16821_t:CDS:2 [Acaulospora colombiana]|uniref:16821_t:CDS:1 n=1 Tax=Acaulospora colombiana TaxID=27376 RepID=A0ACA9NZ59_9GLOM|nr:16821_t:CDS:2 [Acaulospora colombiana]